MNDFKLELCSQNWVDNKQNNVEDLCSHGKIYLALNNQILSDKNSEEWTVASAALRLMKSALYGYDSKVEVELIPCGGYLRLFPNCPHFITWDAVVQEDIITLSNIQVSKQGQKEPQIIKGYYPILYEPYRQQVLTFARKVRHFYLSCPPRKFYDRWSMEEFTWFWKEFVEYYKMLVSGNLSLKNREL